VHLLDEVPKHLLGDVEIGDHPVLQGADRLDVTGRPADHPLRLGTHREDLLGLGVQGDHRRLVEDHATAPDVHERVGRPKVNGHIAP
jgi:hypothetical protein